MAQPAGREMDHSKERHPVFYEPATFIMQILLAIVGAIIGLQLITQLGITPNTSIIGALVAMLIARIPMALFRQFRNLQQQNLLQTAISGATFGAANALLLPIGIPYLLGRPELVLPMLAGATMGMLIDAWIMYRMFDSRVFPATGTWPPGIATGEALFAGDEGGRRALVLVVGTVVGIVGSYLKISMSAFGVAFIGNIWALSMFGIGLLIRGYAKPLANIDINALYVPHGVMIGAGLVALVQIILLLMNQRFSVARSKAAENPAEPQAEPTTSEEQVRFGLGAGFLLYIGAAVILAVTSGFLTSMPLWQTLAFVLFAAFAALASELIVGLSAMHAGWFPAFATALIFLVIGMLLGFPPVALAILVGFTASTGPAFADMGYDLKAGWMVRGYGRYPAFEREGRRQQFYSELVGFACALVMVGLFYKVYFANDLFPPVDRVFVATIKAGVAPGVATSLLIWAIPGAIIQWLGGPARQLGILFATGLLVLNPLAGFAVLAGIAIRLIVLRIYGESSQSSLSIFGAGSIAGDALYGFFTSVAKVYFKPK